MLSPSSIDTCLSNGNVKLMMIAKWKKVSKSHSRQVFLTFCQQDLFCYQPEQWWHRYLSLYEHPQSTWRCSRMTAYLYIRKPKKDETLHKICEKLKNSSSVYDSSCTYEYHKSLTCNIIDNNSNRWISDITWYQTSKSLLSCSIPAL